MKLIKSNLICETSLFVPVLCVSNLFT